MVKNFLKQIGLFELIKILYKGFGSYKRSILLLTVLGFLGAMLEGVGINALIPLFTFVGGSVAGGDPISAFLEKSFAFLHIPFTLKYLVISICTLFLVRALFIILNNYIQIKIATDYEEATRNNLFKKTLNANWNFLLNQKLGHLETVIMTNIRYGELLLNSISSVIVLVASLVAYIFVAVNISLFVTSITVTFGALLIFVVKPLFAGTKKMSEEMEIINKMISHHINENIMGMKTVKTMFVANEVLELGKKFFRSIKLLRVKVAFLKKTPDSLMQSVSFIFIMFIFAITYKIGDFNAAALVAVVYLIQRIFVYAQALQNHINTLGESLPYFIAVNKATDEAVLNKEEDFGKDDFKFETELKFKDVSFSYNQNHKILQKINFSLKQGEMVGLVGPSGGGKTTIADLLLRLFSPDSGLIMVDGKNINEISLKKWRKNIGYVSQDIFLTNNTIKNNIKFYDEEISEEKIIEVSKKANIYDFIMKSPGGFDTVIGERGTFLSAGQRQRIIIARVLARNPKILILDEATSALDNESEAEIQKVLENLKGKVTILVIAHRLSTIMNADKILALEKGKIEEEGSPEKLLRDKDSYFFKVNNILT